MAIGLWVGIASLLFEMVQQIDELLVRYFWVGLRVNFQLLKFSHTFWLIFQVDVLSIHLQKLIQIEGDVWLLSWRFFLLGLMLMHLF